MINNYLDLPIIIIIVTTQTISDLLHIYLSIY